eukprot:scaffold88451_cov50-Attheya_sp.AAC.5
MGIVMGGVGKERTGDAGKFGGGVSYFGANGFENGAVFHGTSDNEGGGVVAKGEGGATAPNGNGPCGLDADGPIFRFLIGQDVTIHHTIDPNGPKRRGQHGRRHGTTGARSMSRRRLAREASVRDDGRDGNRRRDAQELQEDCQHTGSGHQGLCLEIRRLQERP